MKITLLFISLMIPGLLANGKTNPISPDQDKPPQIQVTSDSYNFAGDNDDGTYSTYENVLWLRDIPADGIVDMHWYPTSGSAGYELIHYMWPACPDDCEEGTFTSIYCDGGVTTTNSGDGVQQWVIYNNHCGMTTKLPGTKYRRDSQTTLQLLTGGKASSQRQNLFRISGSATQGTNLFDEVGQPVPKQNIEIMGKHLDTNGNMYVVLPDNIVRDVTPYVKDVDFYGFNVDQQKYNCYFTAYAEMPYPNSNSRWALATLPPDLAGHAWWVLSTDAPLEAFAALNYNPDLFYFVDGNAGYFPSVQLDPLMLFLAVPGTLKYPNGGGARIDALHTFQIGFDDLIGGLTFTKDVYDNPGWYKLERLTVPFTPANNCTTKTVEAGAAANVILPDDWTPQDFGIDLRAIQNP